MAKFGEPKEEDEAPVPVKEPTPDLTEVLENFRVELAALREERAALWRGFVAVMRVDEGGLASTALLDALAPLLPESSLQ